MPVDRKQKSKKYPPSNISTHYYTDPVYSSDGFYGYEEDNDDSVKEGMQEAANVDDTAAFDEPVESWGWVNNADDPQIKQKRGY